MKDFGTNRQFKDRLFVFLFGNEEYKENTLSLYNAVVGSIWNLERTMMQQSIMQSRNV